MNELMIMCTMSIESENISNYCSGFNLNMECMLPSTKTGMLKGYVYMPTKNILVQDAFKEFQDKCHIAHIKLSEISEVILRDKNLNDIDAIRENELTSINNMM